MRSDASPFQAVGQGHRYNFTEDEFLKLKKKFERWNKRNSNSIEVEASDPDPEVEGLEVDEA